MYIVKQERLVSDKKTDWSAVNKSVGDRGMQEKIKCKAILGLPLTERERSMYLLYIASDEEVKDYLKREVRL